MRENVKTRDEFSLICIAFPVSFGVLLISYILNTCADAQKKASTMHMLELFGRSIEII